MKLSKLISLIQEISGNEDPEVYFLGDGEGTIKVDGYGYYEVYESDLEPVISSESTIVGVSLNTH